MRRRSSISESTLLAMSIFEPKMSGRRDHRARRPLSIEAMLARIALTALCVATLEAGVSATVHPGDDFFAFANGAWLDTTAIPAGSPRWTARNEINTLARAQVDRIVEESAAAPRGSEARKVAAFRAAWLDENAIDARGMAPLRPMLERIGGVRDKAALTRLLGSGMRADVDPINWGLYDSASLLGLAVESGNHGETDYVAFLLQGGLGLPGRDHYLDSSDFMQEARVRYQAHIARVFDLVGLDRTAQRAAAVMALETAIARSHATSVASGDDRNAANLWSREDFARRAPGMDWEAFFTAAGLSEQRTFVVWQPGAVEGAAKLVATVTLDTWKDYLRLRVIDVDAEVLPRAFARPASPESAQPPRAQRAMQVTQTAMSGVIGRLYAEKHFPAAQKERVRAIAQNVIAAFRERVEKVSWLTPESRRQALAKLDVVYFGVGYPERWPDYSSLVIDPADAWGNRQRLAQWSYRQALSKIGQRADHTDWWLPPQQPGAILLFQQNAYNFAAALLQPPKYDPTASDAAMYGAIGAIVGHEVSHFVDTLGADYDARGAKVHWWTAQDVAQYEIVTEPLVQQFEGYQPLPGVRVDGKRTRVENVADLAGLSAAFDAYRRALGSDDGTQLVHQRDREFFIAFARAWRAKYRDEGLRDLLEKDGHAPESLRVATVRNLDAWYEAFGVLPRHRLYLDPRLRVRIW
jgi:putative endopeptidase